MSVNCLIEVEIPDSEQLIVDHFVNWTRINAFDRLNSGKHVHVHHFCVIDFGFRSEIRNRTNENKTKSCQIKKGRICPIPTAISTFIGPAYSPKWPFPDRPEKRRCCRCFPPPEFVIAGVNQSIIIGRPSRRVTAGQANVRRDPWRFDFMRCIGRKIALRHP